MRLVYVTGGFPYPLTSGYLRHFHLLDRLAREHEIRLFSLVGEEHESSDRDVVRELGIDVETFEVASTAWRRRTRQLGRLLPRVVAGAAAAQRRAVAECVASGWPHAAILSGKTTSGVLSALDGLPLVVDACDATSMRLESQLDAQRGFDRVLGGLELRAVRSVERRLHDRADHVLVASRRDGDHLGRWSKMSVIANGIDSTYWSRTTATRPGDTVVFTGKMSYPPNEDAALRLIEEVWPMVRRRRPHANLLIVGTSPTSRLVSAGERFGVEVTGRVDDMREYLERGTVFAAPIRHGAGIQNKLLEALAMQLPVVASSNAADGLIADGVLPPVHVTDDLDEMANLIVDELEAADRDPRAIASNRDWVTARFDWDVAAGRIDEVLSRFVEAPDGRGSS